MLPLTNVRIFLGTLNTYDLIYKLSVINKPKYHINLKRHDRSHQVQYPEPWKNLVPIGHKLRFDHQNIDSHISYPYRSSRTLCYIDTSTWPESRRIGIPENHGQIHSQYIDSCSKTASEVSHYHGFTLAIVFRIFIKKNLQYSTLVIFDNK